MEITVTAHNDWQRELAILVPAERVNAAVDGALHRYARRAQLRGFRKGKAPLDMVRRVHGDAIESGAVQDLIPQVVQEAADREGFESVASPQVNQVERTDEGGLRLRAWLEIKPAFTVTGLDGLRATRDVHEVADEDVESALESLRLREAEESVVDRPAEVEDVLVLDLRKIDKTGLPLVGEKTLQRAIQLGSPGARELGFDEQLGGARAGDVRRLRVPVSDTERRVTGEAETHYEAAIREVRERQLPELGDAFAKRIANVETVDALRERVDADLRAQAEAEADRRVRDQLIDALLRENPFEPPASMVERLLAAVTEDANRSAGEGFDAEAFSERARPSALREVQAHLLMERLAQQEGIVVSDADLDEAIREQAEGRGLSVTELRGRLRRTGQLESFRTRLEERKTLAFLKERAHIEEAAVAARA